MSLCENTVAYLILKKKMQGLQKYVKSLLTKVENDSKSQDRLYFEFLVSELQ